jgi:predicted DNA binding CopG/RHH family protein
MSTRIPPVSKIDNFSIHRVKTLVFASKIGNQWHCGLMPNVRIEKAKKAKALGVSLPPELILQAKKHAFSQGMSFSRFVRSLLARELMEIEKK